ncbi:hypothetical protein BGZ51_004147 [Haplosporangium sp. Z 767]|nr:hypothetical protein BGZ51_004147 [Haplosporangium sp. Z 767]KAF9194969.1 hypothetical protein BGZ50_005435 [Haplosporangium sp. Z 11]
MRTTHAIATAALAAAPSGKTDTKKSFWTSPGMDVFIDWVTDPHNHEKLNRKRSISGQKTSGIHDEIAKYVNGIKGTTWDRGTVKSKIQYTKKKYDAARALSTATGAEDTDKEELRSKMLAICPHYDRFHAVYGDSLARSPPPPHQSASCPNGGILNMESDPEISDLDDDATDTASEANLSFKLRELDETDLQTTRSRSKTPAVKRRKRNLFKITEELQESLAGIKEAASQAGARETSWVEREKEREKVLVERERIHQNILSKQSQEHYEIYDRRMRALEDAREEFKQEKAEFKQEKTEFKQEKAEFKQEKQKFQEERERLITENAILKKELELRQVK